MESSKALVKRETDLEQLEVLIAQIAEALEIYNYIEGTVIRDVEVSVNTDDFKFQLEGQFLEVAMRGLRSQLKDKIESLRAQIKLM